ncbi:MULTISPECIES: hypothetical protein [unclassified Streptomyces]|uniref:hypothetical protein n=1 Tax=unclassified Streptomyces TaxID=2593676 RepID=UPI0036EC1916
MTTTDPRAAQLAESRYRNGYGPTLAEPWEQLDTSFREFLANEAASWLRSAIAAGFVDASPTAIADADNPTPLRWGLDDVMWGDDDSVIVLLSGPDREPYWLELDADRADVLRQNLAGPDSQTQDAQPIEPHPTETDLRHALALVESLHGRDAGTPAVGPQQPKEA